jgi:deoxyribodipyrimidine photo-lyase
MEFENVNRAYDTLVKPKNEIYIKAWQEGRTGVPVDACMRCLVATGYINFRMRGYGGFFLRSIYGKIGVSYIFARAILDYEPGIHYPQVQMQEQRGLTLLGLLQ